MKRKTIKTVFANLHSKLIESIDDEAAKELVKKNSIITGGAIVSMLRGEAVNDYDYYFTNRETVEAVANYYVNKFNTAHPDRAIKPRVIIEEQRVRIRVQSAGVASEGSSENYQYFETVDPTEAASYVNDAVDVLETVQEDDKPKFRPIFLTDNAITLSNKIQMVIRFYGSPEEIHDNYDFVHAMSWWRSSDGHLELPAKALEAILTKELLYHGSKYPLASIIRTRKFIQRGWTINAGQYLKMAMQLHDLDLSDLKVLEDQLIGMDAAYFRQIITILQEKQDADQHFKISSAYLIEIIDRLF
ncbi:hypothetical protein [Paenibacillus sp. P46E]|uniref:hypothetical protein n=1 Tax=Paenibacillus sp. P46E TaxID=1349436 RepID=UPI00093C79B2|nr:hypothetical protein [Paenibacillus sp. P46E]OKP97754.1 hypothetical protein A3849_13690 [Paenibacillus sp. P46E]